MADQGVTNQAVETVAALAAAPISGAEKVLLALMLAVIMFGMGAGIVPADVKVALRRPKGILVGLVSQFLVMPFLAVGLALTFQLPPAAAVGLVMVGCLPGGSTSNMFCYFARGDVALSVSMTTCSTLVATVLMPITLGLATAPFLAQIEADGTTLVIPYRDIIATLLLVLLPVAGGMFLRQRSPGWAGVAEEFASFAGFAVILFLIGSWLARADNRALMVSTPPSIYAAVLLLGLAGVAFGWLAAQATKCAGPQRRAIALETGIQNTPVAFAIISISFSGQALQGALLWVPILYALCIVLSASCVTLLLRRWALQDWLRWQNARVQRRLFVDE